MINTASGLSCGLLAPAPKAQWFHDWVKSAKAAADIHELSSFPNDERRQSKTKPGNENVCGSVDAILMFVTRDTMSWARKHLAKLHGDHAPLIAITKGLHADAVQRLLRLGVDDFVKSNCEPEELRLRLWRSCGGKRICDEVESQPSGRSLHPSLSRIIGSSKAFRQQLERVPIIAESDVSVLILGETGTGKELFAQATHYLSRRSKNPWVALNCGALPAELVESELFGHVRGAYTSASESRTGLVATAEGGTLFLDEIGSLPLTAQTKLLRFLQEKEYRVVGSSRTLKANVRIVAASNSDLGRIADQGRFRKDLFYRLNVLTITLPPLRERLEDLLPLAEHFVKGFSREFQRPVSKLSPSAVECIVGYDWPGNVRELEHSIERAVLLCRNHRIEASDLELPMEHMRVSGVESFSDAKSRAVEQFERLYLERMLLLSDGNITRAAEAASKNRRAFWELIRKHQIDASRYRSGVQLG